MGTYTYMNQIIFRLEIFALGAIYRTLWICELAKYNGICYLLKVCILNMDMMNWSVSNNFNIFLSILVHLLIWIWLATRIWMHINIYTYKNVINCIIFVFYINITQTLENKNLLTIKYQYQILIIVICLFILTTHLLKHKYLWLLIWNTKCIQTTHNKNCVIYFIKIRIQKLKKKKIPKGQTKPIRLFTLIFWFWIIWSSAVINI